MNKDALLNQIIDNWNDIRSRTYGVLNVLDDANLLEKLPFERSETIFNQFYCMVGTTNAFSKMIEAGRWQGWSSPLAYREENYYVDAVREHLRASDEGLIDALQSRPLLEPYANTEDTPLKHYLALLEHESHHLGQLINFIYALELPIPNELAEKWNLSRD